MEEMKATPDLLMELLEAKQYSKLRSTMSDMNTADLAAIMDEMENEDSLKMFRILPKDMAADVFADLQMDDQQYIITSLSDKEASNIIDNLMATMPRICWKKCLPMWFVKSSPMPNLTPGRISTICCDTRKIRPVRL